MSLLRLFDPRNWEPFDLDGVIEGDGRLSDKAVFYGCFIAAGVALAFGV